MFSIFYEKRNKIKSCYLNAFNPLWTEKHIFNQFDFKMNNNINLAHWVAGGNKTVGWNNKYKEIIK